MSVHEPGRTGTETISVEEAGRWLGTSKNTAYEAAGRGEIPTLRIGRLLRVPFVRMLSIERTSNSQAA